MKEIGNENFNKLARVYCNYCIFDHWLEIIELYNDTDKDDDKFILEFEAKEVPPFIFRFKEAFSRIKRDTKTLESPVEIVALSIPQAKQLIEVITKQSKLKLEKIHRFPKIEWRKESGLEGIKFGSINVYLREISITIDVTKKDDKYLYIEPIEIGWRPQENEHGGTPKLSFIKLMKRRFNYIFVDKNYLYKRTVGVNEQRAKILFSLIKLIVDNVEEVHRRDGSIIHKVKKENIILESE